MNYNVEVDFTDGTHTATALQFVGPDWQNFEPAVHVSNSNYMVVKNLNGSTAKTICYDGTVTK